MNSYPSADEVFDDFGDKVIEAFARSVARARSDLTTYREFRPAWVATHTERFLANFIHDRMWDHLTDLLQGIREARLYDKEPTREIIIRDRYRLRAKRHDEAGAVSTYPTQTALEFLFQQQAIDGLDEALNLIVGYIWDSELREIGRPVLSLRNGIDIEWVADLPEFGTGYEAAPLQPLPAQSGPPKPGIDTSKLPEEPKETEEGKDQ
jgi:hypothetical protein